MDLYTQEGEKLTAFTDAEMEVIRDAMCHYFIWRESTDSLELSGEEYVPVVKNIDAHMAGSTHVEEFFSKLQLGYDYKSHF